MPHYLIELYTPKSAWLALNDKERHQFFEAIAKGMSALSELGIEAIAMGKADGCKPYAVEQSFFAIWRLPNDEALNALLAGIAAAGWHDYFNTVNAAGLGVDLTAHLEQLAAISKT